MNQTIDERALCELFEARLTGFRSARQSLRTIEQTLRAQGWSDGTQNALQAILDSLTSDLACAQAVKQWNQSDRSGSPRLKQAVQLMKEELTALLEQVDIVATTARSLKQHLEPQVDHTTRARAASQAYRRSSTHATFRGKELG